MSIGRVSDSDGRLDATWTMVQGVRVHARVSIAAGPHAEDVVLVHGLGVSSRYMAPLAERLATGFRVYAPDLPGFGKSDKLPHALDVPGLSDALVAWMDAAGIEEAALVANSFGCQIAVDAAARYPDRVSRLVLLGPTTGTAQPIPMQILCWLRIIPREPLSLALTIIRDCFDCGLLRIAWTLRHAGRDPIAQKISLVSAPTLVLRGDRDTIASAEWVDRLAAAAPNGRSGTFPVGGHAANFDAVDRFAVLVESFLREDGTDLEMAV
jgi:2-hydroxy-6-oxonona-2,4-dienedioate hydrolase